MASRHTAVKAHSEIELVEFRAGVVHGTLRRLSPPRVLDGGRRICRSLE
jgi:hypothetical protein